MTGLKDLLKKKENISKEAEKQPQQDSLGVPEFKFMRTTTNTEEEITPPSYPGDEIVQIASVKGKKEGEHKRHHLGFRKSSNSAITKDPTAKTPLSEAQVEAPKQLPVRPKAERKLSERLHLSHRSRSRSEASSDHLPQDLPDAPDSVALPAGSEGENGQQEKAVNEEREARWEKRATILATSNPLAETQQQAQPEKARTRSRSPSISDKDGDASIQEAIRLHEEGELERSTVMFGYLAEPKGANNALSQVLYGLALRHGWGITPEPEKAIHYLSLAASNSASIEEQALASGMKNGGAAKGELVLAIFELANCFRHGWGVKKDPMAARQYYETAANLGDTDAMDEAAWCYLEGFGGAKDKVRQCVCLSCLALVVR